MSDNNEKKQKVFCIGFNKTGTTTLYFTFLNHGYNAFHGPWHNHGKGEYVYDFYSDGEPPYDYKMLDKKYKNSLFILNTRGLYNWIFSRLKHIEIKNTQCSLVKRCNWYDHSDKTNIFIDWIIKRNNWYKEVLDYFKGKDNFLFLDIESDNIEDELSKFIGFNIKISIKNTRPIELFEKKKKLEIINKYKLDIYKAFEKLNIKKEDYNSIGIIDYIE